MFSQQYEKNIHQITLKGHYMNFVIKTFYDNIMKTFSKYE